MKTLNAQAIASVSGAGFTDTIKEADWKHAAIVGAGTAVFTAGATWACSSFKWSPAIVGAALTAGVAATAASALAPGFVEEI